MKDLVKAVINSYPGMPDLPLDPYGDYADLADLADQAEAAGGDSLFVFLCREIDQGGRGDGNRITPVQVEKVLDTVLHDVHSVKRDVVQHLQAWSNNGREMPS